MLQCADEKVLHNGTSLRKFFIGFSQLIGSLMTKHNFWLICIILSLSLFYCRAVYASQDMEKDNKSLPLRVFSNTMSSFPIDTKSSKATTSMQQISQQQSTHRHPIHPRLTDVQICSNETIDLTSSANNEMIPVNLNAQARPYELNKLNGNMMNIYDVHSPNLDILQGISKGNPTCNDFPSKAH